MMRFKYSINYSIYERLKDIKQLEYGVVYKLDRPITLEWDVEVYPDCIYFHRENSSTYYRESIRLYNEAGVCWYDSFYDRMEIGTLFHLPLVLRDHDVMYAPCTPTPPFPMQGL